jgi:hypothetical protein
MKNTANQNAEGHEWLWCSECTLRLQSSATLCANCALRYEGEFKASPSTRK